MSLAVPRPLVGRARVDAHELIALRAGWQVASTGPDAATAPDELELLNLPWRAVHAAATVAAVLRAEKQWSLDGPPRGFDSEDWWFRLQLTSAPARPCERLVLVFDGLATLAQGWLNGQPILASSNMFVAHEVDVTDLLTGDDQLCLRFAALDRAFETRRPRPRWRAPMVEQQQLRFFRTSLLGRTPGWSPPAAPVGPWRPVWLERRAQLEVQAVRIDARLDASTGVLDVDLSLRWLLPGSLPALHLVVSGPGQQVVAPVSCLAQPEQGTRVQASVRLPDVALWWPATHGEQPLYQVRLCSSDKSVPATIDLGRVGFRTVQLEGPPAAGDGFRLVINGVPIFCRGACWTPLDVVSLSADEAELRQALTQVRDAGMNMLRVMGAMVYEEEAFYDLCDELGLLLWHDFMFANMDYPEDEAFVATVTTEAKQALSRWQGRPALALVCGDSEGAQQAAMWGAPRTSWQRPLFDRHLRGLAGSLLGGVPYCPSSASGGAFPHQPGVGTTSYYGVGAYLRPLEDARRSQLRFASECLAFANIPEETNLLKVPGHGGASFAQSPAWKARSPRDLGAAWDFDDVRDFYLELLFQVDPVRLRWSDNQRFLALGRVAVGEVMQRTYTEWRRRDSSCCGALIWFLRDLWPGAGWGIVDSDGRPKSALHYLRPILQPVALGFSDEGLNGLVLHVFNDRGVAFVGEVRIELYRRGEIRLAAGRAHVIAAPRDGLAINAVELLEGFWDLSYAFRFGPPQADVVVATLLDQDGQVHGEAFHFPAGLPHAPEANLGLCGAACAVEPGVYALTVSTRRLAVAVTIDAGPYQADVAYFNLRPGGKRQILLRAAPGQLPPPLQGTISALNCESAVAIELVTGPG